LTTIFDLTIGTYFIIKLQSAVTLDDLLTNMDDSVIDEMHENNTIEIFNGHMKLWEDSMNHFLKTSPKQLVQIFKLKVYYKNQYIQVGKEVCYGDSYSWKGQHRN